MHYTNCHQFCKPTLSYKLPKNLDEIDLAFTISIKTVITNSNKKTHQSRWNKKTIMATVLIFLTNIHADITYIGMIFSVQDWEIWHLGFSSIYLHWVGSWHGYGHRSHPCHKKSILRKPNSEYNVGSSWKWWLALAFQSFDDYKRWEGCPDGPRVKLMFYFNY